MSEFENTGERIVKVNIEDQMKSAYIDYSMSVIVSRALPDVRDGMKPVHRRVLFGMHELGVFSNRPTKKSARIVGEVLGKYHPHGDTSVYDAMVRMAQEWSLRYPLVEGQGNFGSIDGDSAAAMRYTEARLRKIAEEILADIDKETVDMQLNFDDSLEEPTVLPAKVPNLLLNGASGIAVGMATNMAPHNLKEVVDGIVAYIDDNEITIEGLMKYIKAPDFPTGGIIYGYDGVKEAYETGRGRVVMRGEANVEVNEKHTQIIIKSIPYQVNKSELLKKFADLVNEKIIDGVTDLRDESDRDGMRIVLDLRRDAVPNVIINQLYQHSPFQSAFNVNNIALVHGRPMMLNLKDLIRHFVDHRHVVVVRRTQFELREAEKRAHILEGLLIALDNIDEVVDILRSSKSVDQARERLMERFSLSDIQSRAIVDMRLRSLIGLERDKLRAEYDELMQRIEYFKKILDDLSLRMQIIKDELLEIKEKFGDEPRTDIVYQGKNFRIEDTIANDSVVITISRMGYIKRTLLSEYRTQNRGGKGFKASNVREEDILENLYIASNHDYLLVFTKKGKVFWIRVYEIPEGARASKGRPIQNLLSIENDDKIQTVINVADLTNTEYVENNFIILCTEHGVIKKTSLEAYSRPRQNGINAIGIREGDTLIQASLTNGKNEVLIALRSGRAIRFPEEKVRPMGRNASGVRGVTLAGADDRVVGMVCIEDKLDQILVVSEKGFGKRSDIEDYRVTNRGGKGVKTINVTEKTGKLVAAMSVKDGDELMIINVSGIAIRMSVSDLRVVGRATQGVKLINLSGKDSIASVAKIASDFVEIEEIVEENVEENEQNPTENESAEPTDEVKE
ncbi:MAG: DNA gyrase subunit A [Bacteroidetes bacterium GWF2_43_63]|nr:MAG: DNA gyrase subunit A [Bacteroidetes bacterium GWE2_42_42]OFY54831.1 MAG: DNA gyrase subunit A [Bacteroidetes bacterium GWF2_43_63]HCB63269.1 DNA gyrase subunit A [Bacteroidales bacterium]HCY22011.1 DNA gyrase subunit A [Bacteroidales bacterium]